MYLSIHLNSDTRSPVPSTTPTTVVVHRTHYRFQFSWLYHGRDASGCALRLFLAELNIIDLLIFGGAQLRLFGAATIILCIGVVGFCLCIRRGGGGGGERERGHKGDGRWGLKRYVCVCSMYGYMCL